MEPSTFAATVPIRGGPPLEDLRKLLTEQFSAYVHDPQIFVNPGLPTNTRLRRR